MAKEGACDECLVWRRRRRILRRLLLLRGDDRAAPSLAVATTRTALAVEGVVHGGGFADGADDGGGEGR
jgi:hypothetical protein